MESGKNSVWHNIPGKFIQKQIKGRSDRVWVFIRGIGRVAHTSDSCIRIVHRNKDLVLSLRQTLTPYAATNKCDEFVYDDIIE